MSNNRILVKWLLNALYNNKYVPVCKKCKAYTYGNSNTLLGIYPMKPSLIKMLEYQILYTIFFLNQIPLSAYKNAFILQIYNGTFYLMAH